MNKPHKITIALLAASAFLFASCAAVTSKLATKENIEKLPEPLKGQIQQLVRQQEAIAVKYTAGTRQMLEAYATIAEAVGMKTEAAILRAESQALNAGSSLADTRKALSKSESVMKEVRSKLTASKGVAAVSKEKFAQGQQIKSAAYGVELAAAVDASVQAVKGIKAIKTASPMQKVMLTVTLDPLFFIARDVPKFLATERKFNDECVAYAKEQNIVIPTRSLPTPKLANLAF